MKSIKNNEFDDKYKDYICRIFSKTKPKTLYLGIKCMRIKGVEMESLKNIQ